MYTSHRCVQLRIVLKSLKDLSDEAISDATTDTDFVHVVGHFDFVEGLLDGLSAAKRATARRALERYELLASPWSQVVGELAKLGLGRQALSDLALMDICGQ